MTSRLRTTVRVLVSSSSARTYSPLTSGLLMLPLVLLLCAVFYFPIARLLLTSVSDTVIQGAGSAPIVDASGNSNSGLTLSHYQAFVAQPINITIFLRTLRTALLVTVAALVVGYPVAFLISRLSGWRAALVAGFVLVPLWTSVLVRSYAWTVLLGRHGMINSALLALGWIHEPLKLLYTDGAVWLAMTHILLPIMILPIYAALRGIPRDLTLAAQSLGAGRLTVFRHVVFPLSLPGVAAGSVIVYILGLGFFVTPQLVGGPSSLMLATLIAQQATVFMDWPLMGAISVVLLMTTIAIVVVFNRSLRLDRVLGEGG